MLAQSGHEVEAVDSSEEVYGRVGVRRVAAFVLL